MAGKKDPDITPQINELIVKGIQEKKGSDITILNLSEIENAIADYFVICTGNSDSQVDAIIESIEEQVSKNARQEPWQREGMTNKEWVLLDYVDVVVHVFRGEARTFYALEELWGDAIITKVGDVA
jgi:ribosome-associated protein